MNQTAPILRAADRAARAHAGQTRSGGRVPHVNHAIKVARLVAQDGRAPETVAAALRHDVVEDTPTTRAALGAEFGGPVAAVVGQLTGAPDWAALPRPERERRQAAPIAEAPAEARAIKIADHTSHLRDMGRLPRGRAPAGAEAHVAATEPMVDACRDAAPRRAALHDAAVREAPTGPASAGGGRRCC